MIQRGRKSAASLSVVVAKIDAIQRPDPPEELSDEEAEVWRTVVGALRADWFTPEVHPLLVQYCHHVANARRIAQALRAADLESGIARFNRLSGLQFRESAAIARLATKMRLTPQSSADRKKTKHAPVGPRPWEE